MSWNHYRMGRLCFVLRDFWTAGCMVTMAIPQGQKAVFLQQTHLFLTAHFGQSCRNTFGGVSFFLAVEAFKEMQGHISNKGKAMKGLRTMGQRHHGGRAVWGGPVLLQQEKASSASSHKRWSFLCARGGFPFTETGFSATQKQISPSSLVFLGLSLTVTHLFLHCINIEGGGGQCQTYKKERREGRQEDERGVCSRWVGLCESSTDLCGLRETSNLGAALFK